MPTISNRSTPSPPDVITEEFIKKHMSLIVAAVIGTIILGLLVTTGFMYLTKKKDHKKTNSTDSKPISHRQPEPKAPSRNQTIPSAKSSPSVESPLSSVISSGGSIQTEKSSLAQSVQK